MVPALVELAWRHSITRHIQPHFATLPPASLKSIFQAWIGDIMGDDKLVGQ